MGFWKNVRRSAGIASVATSAATFALGKRELGKPFAPLNATSHIAYGDEAARQDGASLRYSAVGAGINASAMFSWAIAQELILGRWVGRSSTRAELVSRALAAGAATSAVAYITDYHVVPERLTPGFEKRLSPTALAITYGVLAAALALGISRRR